MERLEHEAVAAERDQDFGLVRVGENVAPAQHRFGGLGDLGRATTAGRCRAGRSVWPPLVGLAASALNRCSFMPDRAKIRASTASVTVPFRGAPKPVLPALERAALGACHAEMGQHL